VSSLTTTEEHGELDLVAVVKELASLVDLDAQVVIVDLRAKADFLELALFGVAARLLLFLFLLVLPLPIVHDLADRWTREGRDFDEVQLRFFSAAFGFVKFDNADLRVVLVDEANGGDSNLFVDAQLLAGGALRRLEACLADDRFSSA
jgi:hypothetical protein